MDVNLLYEAEGMILLLARYFAWLNCGRHTPFAGSANIQGGVTIDLSSLNQIVVSQDQTQVSIGPGNRWADVYLKLDALGLSTSGGRVSTVGVGGLTLGGSQVL